MRIVHLNYTLAKPKFTDPEKWLARTKFVNGVVESMTSYGEMIVIYNIHFKGELRRNNVKYIFPGLQRWQLVLPFELNRMIAKMKPEGVLIHGLRFPWQVAMLRRACGPHVRIVVQHHAEVPFTDFRKYLFRMAEPHVGAYLFTSNEQGNAWVKAKHISSPKKIHEIIGTSSVFKPGNASDARKRLNIGNEFVFIWIGDLNNNKDPLLAARAFTRFANERQDVSLYMIYQSNELEQQLRALIAPGVPIHLIGRVDHDKLQDWFSAAHFIISTSHYEGSGIAVIEAMSCGCIPLLTNIPSFRKMTDQFRFGRVFNADDEEDLLKVLKATLNMDVETEAAKVAEHFERELSFAANARKIVDVFNSIE